MLQARFPRFAVRSYQRVATSHAHEHAQAVLPIVGSMDLAMDDRRGRVADRIGVVIPAHLTHRFDVDAANRFVVLDFESRAPSGSFFAIDDELVHLLRYVNELGGGARLAPDVQMHAGALLCAAVRRLAPRGPHRSTAVLRAMALIGERFAQPLRVAEIAEAAGLSPSHLHAEFRRQLGRSPAGHLADVRLAAAVERLRGTDESIAQIALDCGYSEQSALNRALRRRFGTSPGALRRSSSRSNRA